MYIHESYQKRSRAFIVDTNLFSMSSCIECENRRYASDTGIQISIFFLFHFCDSFNLLRYKYFHHKFEHITRVHRII